MIRIGGEHRHVTHLARVLDAYEVDRVEQAALVRDRRSDLRERPGLFSSATRIVALKEAERCSA